VLLLFINQLSMMSGQLICDMESGTPVTSIWCARLNRRRKFHKTIKFWVRSRINFDNLQYFLFLGNHCIKDKYQYVRPKWALEMCLQNHRLSDFPHIFTGTFTGKIDLAVTKSTRVGLD
jgi:hypothetical protein